MNLSSQISILFLSAFLLSAFGKAAILEKNEDPYLTSLKQKCSSTLTRSCKDTVSNPDKNYLAFLTCLETNSDKQDEQCKKEFFSYKLRLYTNPAFLSTLHGVCGDEMTNLCEGMQGAKQIDCLFKTESSRIKGACSSYLGQMGQVMISDYAVLSDIDGACAAEIDSLGCTLGVGKLGVFGSPVIKIVQCLMANSNKLSANCARKFSSEGGKSKAEVEMHEECKNDISKLCRSGADGFECLLFRLSEISSPSCLDTLLERQGYYFRSLDIGLDFYQFCSADVRKQRCAESKVMRSSSEGEFTKLTELLSCLGKDSALLSEECEQEVELLRERFIGEHVLSVEFARACETAREEFCSSNYVSLPDCLADSLEENRDAQFKECKGHLKLLTSSRDITTLRLPPPPQKQVPIPVKLEPGKQDAAKKESVKQDSLKKDAIKQESAKQDAIKQDANKKDPGKQDAVKQEPLKKDTVKQREFPKPDLLQFCGEELESLCSISRGTDYKNTMLCLTHHLYDHAMSLMYFSDLGRVMYFSPDSKLERSCASELLDACNTDKTGRMACLVSHHATSETAAEALSAECAYEVDEFLRTYAATKEMQDDLFRECLPSLGQLCPSQSQHHTELECLREQQELIEHTSTCFDQLEEFNAVEEIMPAVNANVYERCHKAINTYCSHLSSHQLVDCLQESMSIPGFDPECKKALTHIKEVSNPEWNLDPQLNKNCRRDISVHCPHVKRVNEAINCLYPVYQSGVLNLLCSAYIEPMFDQIALQGDNKPTDSLIVSQVKDYSPVSLLETSCVKELQLFCATILQEKHLECLIGFKLDVRVSPPCQKAIITEEIDFMTRRHMDEQVMADCKEDIHSYCMFDSRYEVLICLQSMDKAGAISPKCKSKLEKVSDSLKLLQLDKNLAIQCHSAAFQKCKQKLGNSEKLVNCLSKHMRELEAGGENKKCINDVVVLIGQAQLDINKDPDLAEKCRSELNRYCSNVAMGHGEKIRCLFRLKESSDKLMSSSCSIALVERQDLWSSLSKRYPNIQRGVEAILDDFEILKQTVYPNIVGILKAIFLVGLMIGIVAVCCLCRATRRVRRKIL